MLGPQIQGYGWSRRSPMWYFYTEGAFENIGSWKSLSL